MRIVSFYHDKQIRLGIAIGETILDAAAAARSLQQDEQVHVRDALSFVRGGAAARLVADRLIRQTPEENLLVRENVRIADHAVHHSVCRQQLPRTQR
jgi:hypothetical protein